MKLTARRVLIAASASLAVGLAGCSGGAANSGNNGGGDDASISVGILADLTGATGDVGKPYNEGMLGYIDWVNAKGGIDGHTIEPMSNDYAYQVPKSEELYKKYVNDGAVVIQGWGTGDSEALRTKVGSDKLPFMSASYAEGLTDPKESPYNFVVAPTYLDLGYQSYPMPSKNPDFVGLLSQAQSQGAKYIVIQNVSSPAAQVAKDIKAGNLDMKIVCLNWCADEFFVKTAGNDAAEGHIMVQPFAPASANKPGNKDVEDYLKSKGSSLKEKGVHYTQGWHTMAVMAAGIEKVLDNGDELTGENIKNALETMDEIDTGGVVGTGKVKFSADSHRGSTGSSIYQVEGGDFSEIAANMEP